MPRNLSNEIGLMEPAIGVPSPPRFVFYAYCIPHVRGTTNPVQKTVLKQLSRQMEDVYTLFFAFIVHNFC